MESPDHRSARPRKRDRFTRWLKDHLPGSRTPSPVPSSSTAHINDRKMSTSRSAGGVVDNIPQGSRGPKHPTIDTLGSAPIKLSPEPTFPRPGQEAHAPTASHTVESGFEVGVIGAHTSENFFPLSYPEEDIFHPGASTSQTRFHASRPPAKERTKTPKDEVNDGNDRGNLLNGSNLLAPSPQATLDCSDIAGQESTDSSGDEYEPQTTLKKLYEGVKTTLRVVEKVSNAFPPLQSVAASLLVICDTIDGYKENRKEFEKLLQRVDVLSAIMVSWPKDPSLGVEDRFTGLARTLGNMKESLQSRVSKRRFMLERIALTAQDKEEVLKATQEIRFAIEIAMFEAMATNERRTLQVVEGIEWLKTRICIVEETAGVVRNVEVTVQFLWKEELLRKLGQVNSAEYSNPKRGNECIPGSRLSLLAMLFVWAEDPKSPHLFWLNGLAGTGKTAIAKTFCVKLNERRLLGASFFCSVNESDLKDVYIIIPTLAKILAQEHPQFGHELQRVLAEDQTCRNPTNMKLKDQYTKLILQPAEIAFTSGEILVFCVDALDECEDHDAIEGFLSAILSQTPTTSIKFFLTSRPERSLRQPFKLSTHHQSLRLHEIQPEEVQADITLFLENQFKSNPEIYAEYQKNWPPNEIEKIVEFSGNLFIVASTAFKYITSSNGMCVRRLQLFVRRSSNLQTKGIDDLYRRIFQEAFKDLEDDEAELVHSCISLLVTAQKPLSVSDYGKLLRIAASTVREAFKGLHSVVQVPDDGDDTAPISTFHASLIDYLAPEKPRSEAWVVNTTVAHSKTAESCFNIMRAMLCMGISGATTSYRSNDDQPDVMRLSTELEYACTTWGEHIIYAGVDARWQTELRDFLGGPMALYWLEALSATKNVRYAYIILWRLSKVPAPADFIALLKDVASFAYDFQTPIAHSSPHIYLSALPFYNASKQPSQISFPKFTSTPTVEHRLCRGPEHLAIHSGIPVSSMAISPDGKRIVSGGVSGLRAFNTQTGEPIYLSDAPLEDNSDKGTSPAFFHTGGYFMASASADVWAWDVETSGTPPSDCSLDKSNFLQASLAFSPNGKSIASGLGDMTLCVWDAETGKLTLGPLTGHTAAIRSVAFSPDNKYIVSSSVDSTIRVWDAQRGLTALNVIEGHCDAVWSVAFSPDGKFIVSGSVDKTVRVWNADTGKPALGPLEGHAGNVFSVGFSPDGRYIASGSSDWTVRVWDAQTGKPAVKPFEGHEGTVWSVAFSLDGRYIVSGSADWTVRVWDTRTGKSISRPLEGHDGEVSTVLVSPDGKYIISGSHDETIRVWDMELGEVGLDSLPIGHAGWVPSVASESSPPSRNATPSGSKAKAIPVPRDGQTGENALAVLAGHTANVWSVTFSPDGRYIVSGSEDETIRMWDAQTGEPALGPVFKNCGHVTSLAFSPDGRSFVTGTHDGIVRVWNVETGKPAIRDLLEGHNGGSCSVAFSPDGRFIIAGFRNGSIWMWDARTGRVTLGPVCGRDGGVLSVAFSPNGRSIVSGAEDGTIRVWDAQAGSPALNPIKGHTGLAFSVAFSPDGRSIVSCSGDTTIRLWDAETGNLSLGPLEGDEGDSFLTVAFSRDGRYIVSGSNNGVTQVWDVQTGMPAFKRPLYGHSDSVLSVAFSPHRNQIVSGSSDKTIRVWKPVVPHLQELPIRNQDIYYHDYPHDSLPFDYHSGWVRNHRGELLMWVPLHYRKGLLSDGVQHIIGNLSTTKIRITDAVYHGEDWLKCGDSPPTRSPENAPHQLPWPL